MTTFLIRIIQLKIFTFTFLTTTLSGYRESAYLLALSSAGAAWGVATACAQGWLAECKCVPPKINTYGMDPQQIDDIANDPDWQWSGCSYGVQYGIGTARKLFTRTTGHLRMPLRKLEKHNLKAGRMVSH